MELLFRSCAPFEDDLSRLGEAGRAGVIKSLNELLPGYLRDRDSFCSLLESPDGAMLGDGFCSSLSILGLPGGMSVVLTIDDDPIFDQVIVTLIRLAPAHESVQVYREVKRALHRSLQDPSPLTPVGG